MKEDQGSITVGEKAFEALWVKAFQDEPRRPAGPGWKSVLEIAAARGITKHGAWEWAEARVRGGLFECVSGRGKRGLPAKFYRPKK